MLQQAQDLLEEGQELKKLLSALTDEEWTAPTPFKDWTVNKVVQHLHGADCAAVMSLTEPDKFKAMIKNPKEVSSTMNPKMEGQALFERWWSYFSEMTDQLGASDPKRRCPWFGPDMGVMMFTTARQMETWAHAHDIYDLKKVERTHTDRIKNIAEIGVRTYGWTFANRKQEPPGPAPYVRLTAPSGAVWEWNEEASDNRVEGQAVDFCHVVTQGRNIADVNLDVTGEPATQWMAIAQCFAGPPETPPAPGSRV